MVAPSSLLDASPSVTSLSSLQLQSQPSYVSDPPIETVVFAWGASEDGQLGLDTRQDVPTPKVVEALLGTRFCGRQAGRVPLIAGSRASVGIDVDGQVLAWGWNGRGTLGRGHREAKGAERPQRVLGLEGRRVVQVALGGWHCLALDARGQVYAWGGNEYGQCGLEEGLKDVVTARPCLQGMRFRRIAAGGMHSLALTDSGEIWIWGEPWGDFSMTVSRRPRRIDTRSDYVEIASGAFHNLAITSEGQCLTWGINDFGQLGNGTTNYATVPEPVVGLEGVHVTAIAAGGWHSLAIASTGEVYVWGRGEYGRLGVGDRSGTSRLRPTLLTQGLEGRRVVQASCGGTHTAVVTDEGRCFIWGRAAFGRLGSGHAQDLLAPAELALPGGPERWRVVAVGAGGRHSLALAVPDSGRLAPRLEREATWAAGEADDEATEGAASPEGGSDDGGGAAGWDVGGEPVPVPGEEELRMYVDRVHAAGVGASVALLEGEEDGAELEAGLLLELKEEEEEAEEEEAPEEEDQEEGVHPGAPGDDLGLAISP
ncbi:hypothetical protein ACKKBG_A24525 [Auxenochlorella protothecoides x Auxenochlorella symbiontica]